MDSRAIAFLLAVLMAPSVALGQACPAVLSEAKRLVLVTTENMDATPAMMQWFERVSTKDKWRALGRADQSGGRQARARGRLSDRWNLRYCPFIAAGPHPSDRRHHLRR